ncbi:aldehyde dehydrogenase family protein [Nocardia sp. NPDC019395]|uniref:aldehyde dehydrogenase family protein n=1 Tax=Nocardia sp. NPDC019395 TaxID=3154686 RepID=UPI00341172D5
MSTSTGTAILETVRENHYIGGVWTPSAVESFIDIHSARTGTVLGRVPEGGHPEVDSAVAAARAAQPAWEALPPADRKAFLHAVADGIRAREEMIVRLVADEIGCIGGTARAMQIGMAAHTFDDAADNLDAALAPTQLGNSDIIVEARGVVAAITPWNFPLYQAALKVAPALAVGCTVVLKPSEVAGLTAYVLADIIDEAGLPPGVFNLVSGYGPVVGEHLAGHRDVDAVSFTGSDRAGARVAEVAGAAITPVTLELGGKSAHVLLDDHDLEAAVRYSVGSAFGNNGQVCAALSRLIVPRSILPEVERLVVAEAESYLPGDPLDAATKLGPLVSRQQHDRLVSIVTRANEDGSKVLLGGTAPIAGLPDDLAGGYYFAPTVFTDVDPASTIGQEEAFGPVLAILTYDGGDDDAAAIANGTPYGLNAAVWCEDADRAARFARKVNASTVYINAGKFNPSAPFGGTKGSGFGRERGIHGLHEYVHTKAIQS